MIQSMRWFFILPFLFCGCSPHTPEDFWAEGEAKCRQISLLLQEVRSAEDFEKVEGALKKKFQSMVLLMIAAEKKQHQSPMLTANRYNQTLSEQLQRIYEIKGGKEWIEKCQREPLIRLDAALQKLKKKKERAYLK